MGLSWEWSLYLWIKHTKWQVQYGLNKNQRRSCEISFLYCCYKLKSWNMTIINNVIDFILIQWLVFPKGKKSFLNVLNVKLSEQHHYFLPLPPSIEIQTQFNSKVCCENIMCICHITHVNSVNLSFIDKLIIFLLILFFFFLR